MIKVGWNSHDEFSSVSEFCESCSFHNYSRLFVVVVSSITHAANYCLLWQSKIRLLHVCYARGFPAKLLQPLLAKNSKCRQRPVVEIPKCLIFPG